MHWLDKIKTPLLGAILTCIVLGPVAHSDDTEIFFGQSRDAFNTNPNILFVLDTSGSMNNYDGGSSSRMDRMKMAMRVLLRESSSYNVGLMGFSGSNRGGSIHFPVGDLEADSGSLCPDGICPDERVVVRPESLADDATQNDDTQVVTLNAQQLSMAEVIADQGPATDNTSDEVTGTAMATAIVAESENADGTPNTRTITSTTTWFYNGTPESDDDRYAYRFENIAIPEGAVVTAATLTFTQTKVAEQAGNLSALVRLESSANPDELPTAANGFASIASRMVAATRGVQWNNIAPDTTGTKIETGKPSTKSVTPDLSEILNLVVTLPSWKNGNPLSFILDPVDEYTPSDADVRLFHGIDAAAELRPVLNYTYTTDIDTELVTTVVNATAHLDEITQQNTDIVSRNLSNAATRTFFTATTHYPRKLAFRFDNIDIPADAEIQTASLVVHGSANASDEAAIEDWIVDTSTVPDTTPETDAGAESTGGTPPTTTEGDVGSSDITTGDSTETDTAAENILSFNIKAESTGAPAPYASDPLNSRAFTDDFVAWENLVITPDEELTSPNLGDVVSAVINTDTWNAGSNLSLMLTAPTTYNNVEENSGLIDTSAGYQPPSLHITWKAGLTVDDTVKNAQTTALRFSNVHVPPEAVIKSARLVFTASTASIDPVTLEISAENVSASPPILGVANNIGGRQRTPEKVQWEVAPWDLPNQKYYSDDIKELVQSVVDLPEWCGGNPLTVFLEKVSGDDSRHAISTDQNEISGPTLEITYEPGTVPPGAYCSNASYLSSVVRGSDDVTEDTVTNTVTLNSASLDTVNPDTGNPQKIGLMFSSLGVPKDAVIVSANLDLVYEKDITQAQDYKFQAEQTLDALGFNNSDQKISAASRVLYPTSATETARPGIASEGILRVDIAALLTEKVTDPSWEPGKPLVLIGEALGGVAQSFYSYEAEEARAPKLVVYYQSQRENPGTLFRDNLISIVDSMVAQSGTPVVGSYFEAAQYFSGGPVDYGLQRGSGNDQDRFHRVSHPMSYIDGIVDRPSGCEESDLSAYACRGEQVLPNNGLTPSYVSPIESECQQSHIVILSDGVPTSNTAASKVRAKTGDSTCIAGGSQECGVELAKWLNGTDIDSSLEGIQNVTTHTIGFNLTDPQFLIDLATNGGGKFYSAASAAELLNAFKNIFINVSKTDTSFVAPSATVSQSNRLKNRDDIYFSLFKPEGTARWAGNLKRYKLGGNNGDTADILDVNDALAVDERTGRFFSTAQSYWSDVVDGDSALLGGAAEQIETNGVSHLARKVFTYTGVDTALTNGVYNDLLPDNTYIKREWLKLTSTLAADENYVTKLINWAHGKDEFDIDGDSDTDEARAQMGDPMHSQPLLVNYVGDRSVVHVATNEGFLHSIESSTGEENYAFIPKELLPNIRRLYENRPTSSRPYGLDGGMTLWVEDANNDGLVDPSSDKAYLYIGMRRGGNLYYALDISDPDKPNFLWSIAGGANTFDTDITTADGDYSELGDTWSKPIKSKIYDGAKERDVLIFGAGYGSNQDPEDPPEEEQAAASETSAVGAVGSTDNRQTRDEDTVGRGFFIVDAKTGAKIWNTENAFYADMKYSVPSDLRVIDINFDGLADQIYFGDMGGQVWRFDYNNDVALKESVDNRMNGGLIARFGGDTPETARRFYYPPDIALLNLDGEQQLSVSIGSGWRAHPLDVEIEDRFYSFRMTQVYGVPLTEDGEVRYPDPITETTTGMIDLANAEPLRTTNKNEKGWFLPMQKGEKVLNSSVTIDGNLVFTTYLPSDESATCAAAIGSGAVYFLDLATGNPVKNLSEVDDDTSATNTPGAAEFNAFDRRRRLPAAGIPPEATVLFPELGKATVFAGRDKLNEVEINTLKTRTFWQELIEENL